MNQSDQNPIRIGNKKMEISDWHWHSHWGFSIFTGFVSVRRGGTVMRVGYFIPKREEKFARRSLRDGLWTECVSLPIVSTGPPLNTIFQG
jgi:hypothetical protein